jgi:hypothetical protein
MESTYAICRVLGKWQFNHFNEILGDVFNNDTDWIENKHQTRNSRFKISPHNLLEAFDINRGRGFSDPKLVDKGEKCPRGNAPATKCNKGIQAGIIPIVDMSPFNQFDNLALRQNSTG